MREIKKRDVTKNLIEMRLDSENSPTATINFKQTLVSRSSIGPDEHISRLKQTHSDLYLLKNCSSNIKHKDNSTL